MMDGRRIQRSHLKNSRILLRVPKHSSRRAVHFDWVNVLAHAPAPTSSDDARISNIVVTSPRKSASRNAGGSALRK